MDGPLAQISKKVQITTLSTSHLQSCDLSQSEKVAEIKLPLVLPSLHSVSLYCHTRVQSPLWLQLNLTLLLECLSHF